MEQWQDQGIVLAVRRHGEGAAIVSLLTQSYGRHAGYVRGAFSTRMRGVIEAGNLVHARWQSRVEGDLGAYTLEPEKAVATSIMDDGLRFGALMAACALCESALPEREVQEGLFHGLCALQDALTDEKNDLWAVSYIVWEIALLRELGFSLDLTRCAGGGDVNDLCYVSPNSGHAVSRAQGAPYTGKLLRLPPFLRPNRSGEITDEDILDGLKLNAYFLEHWVYNHHTKGVPTSRSAFQERFDRYIEKTNSCETNPCNLPEKL